MTKGVLQAVKAVVPSITAAVPTAAKNSLDFFICIHIPPRYGIDSYVIYLHIPKIKSFDENFLKKFKIFDFPALFTLIMIDIYIDLY